MKILVSGANGQLGKCLQDVAHLFPGAEYHFLGREHFNLSQFDMVTSVLHALRPDWVINAAAYTAVDKAESESAQAFLINGEGVGHLASACRSAGARLVHVSTDYVFDGEKQSPYLESDPVNPTGKYGQSKLLGEQLAFQHAPDSIVVRTSWVYSRHGANFVKTMIRLMGQREEIGVVNDQLGCPTYAIDLAEALLTICHHLNPEAGIFHYANAGIISWYDFAVAIRDELHSPCRVNPITTSQYPTPARRPAWSALDTSKIRQSFGVPIHPWRTSLHQCMQLLST